MLSKSGYFRDDVGRYAYLGHQFITFFVAIFSYSRLIPHVLLNTRFFVVMQLISIVLRGQGEQYGGRLFTSL